MSYTLCWGPNFTESKYGGMNNSFVAAIAFNVAKCSRYDYNEIFIFLSHRRQNGDLQYDVFVVLLFAFNI